MITIRFNPKALSREGQIVKSIDHVPGKSLMYYVEQAEFDHENVGYILSGRKAESSSFVRDGDEIIIVPGIQIFAAIAAFFALSSFWVTVATIADAVLAIGFLVYSLVQGAKAPNYGTTNDSSPTYGFDGIQNTADQGTPIPIVYGEIRTGGQVIGEYVNIGTALTIGGGSNPEVDNNYLNLLLAVSEGQIDSINDIEINGNPIDNYEYISISSTLGTNTQAPIPAFQQVHDLRSVNEQLTQSLPEVYTTFNAINAIELHMLMPDGLYSEDQNSGNIESFTCEFLVEYKIHTSPTWLTYNTITVSNNTEAAQRFIVRLDETNVISSLAIYDIRLTQLTQNSDFYTTTYLTWDTVDEITYQDLAYPNTALLALNALATSQLSGSTPTVTSVIRGILHSIPNVVDQYGSTVIWDNYYYNPASTQYQLISNNSTLFWDGSTFITGYSANPVWCLMDLLTNTRYGLGQFITSEMVDLTQFIAESQYCENLVSNGAGGYEKQLKLNIVLDQSQKVLDWIGAICASFRGLIYYSAGTVKVKIDRPGTPVQLFTMGNIKDGGFSQTWLPLKQRYNVIQIQFLNETIDYQNDQIAVVDDAALAAGAPMRLKSLRMYTTSPSQATREAQIILNQNKYLTRIVNLKVDIDALTCEAGDLISVAHDVPAWGIQSGHVQSGSTTSAVNLDYPVTIPSGGSYAILIRHAADDTIEERLITNTPGTYTTLNLTSALTEIASGDVYSVGEVTLETKPFRIVSIKYNGDFTCDIQASEYNPTIYDYGTLPTFTNYSALSNQVPNVTDLTLSSGIVINPDGTVVNSINVYFNPPSPIGIYVMYESANVYISDNGGANWVFAGNVVGGQLVIDQGLVTGTKYTIAVCSVDANGHQVAITNSAQSSITANGKTTPPSNVSSFLVNQNKTTFTFGWTPIADLDLSGYEIRFGATWVGGNVLATQIKTTTYVTVSPNLGTTQFWICAIDSSGNYSTTPTEAVVTVAEIPYQNIIESYAEEPGWSGTLVDLTVVSSVLEIAAGYTEGTYSTPVRDLGYIATFTIQASTVITIPNSTVMNATSTLMMNSDLTSRMSGANAPNPGQLYIRTSLDNMTWTAWQSFQTGDYTCRYFQLSLIAQRSDVSTTIEVSGLDYYADLPSVVDSGSGSVVVAASGVVINFVKTFHQSPVVNVTILTGSGIYSQISSVTLTEFLVKLYNASGTPETGAFNWVGNGV